MSGCKGCGGAKPKRQGVLFCTTCRPKKVRAARGKPKIVGDITREECRLLRNKQYEEYNAKQREVKRKRSAEFKAQGLNTQGASMKVGWREAMDGLAPNPVLDQDYEFGSEERLSLDDLKWLL